MLDSKRTNDSLLEPLLRILADSPEFDEVPVRHNEDQLCGELAKFCHWKVDSLALDDPHTKTFLLLQAKHQGINLPIQDFVTDTSSVMQQMPRLVQALAATDWVVGFFMRFLILIIQSMGSLLTKHGGFSAS